MNKKGIRTTIIGVIGMVTFLALVGVYLFTDKITTADFAVAAPCITTLFTTLVAFSAKDSDKSHSIEDGK